MRCGFSLASLGGDKLISGSVDRTVRIWTVADGQCERVMRAHNGPVTSIHMMKDGRVLTTSNDQPDNMCSPYMYMWSPSNIDIAPGGADGKSDRV